MAIDVSVQYNDGGFLLDIIVLTLCDYIGEPFRYHEESYLNILIIFPPKVDAQKVSMRSDFS